MKLIDIFRVKDVLYAWLYDGKNHFKECVFEPELHVFARKKELEHLQKTLSFYGVPSYFAQKKTIRGIKLVLSIKRAWHEHYKIIQDIDKLSNFRYEIFNADIPLQEHYLFEKDLFPNGEVRVVMESDKILDMTMRESPMQEYEIPKLSKAFITLKTSYPLSKNLDAQLLSICLNGTTYTQISDFVTAFISLDPDIIITKDGNRELPYLLRLIRKQYPDFSFSRFGRDSDKISSSSHLSYGRMIYKQHAVYLKGRIHFRSRGVLYGKWNIDHPFELARTCRVTLQRINHRSVGYGVNNLQLFYAMRNDFLIPRKTSCVEVWKNGTEMLSADRGAFIYEPRMGFHQDVAEIDFTSLFPSIMVKYNISTETLYCSCCRENKVPGLSINICKRQKGIMGQMLDPIIRQREYYKQSDNPRHKERANALKGFLVCSFGYMGFRKSKFARIESHQSIQAYAREVLLEASKIAEGLGFEVLHGHIDNLFIKKKGITKKDVDHLLNEIYYQLGFPCKSEGIYHWIVFLPSTKDAELPVANRFYAVFDTGEVKCRGIEIRRRDQPRIIHDLQRSVISELSVARTYEELLEQIRKSKSILRDYIERLLCGRVPKEDLIFTKAISKTEYDSYLPQALMVQKLQSQGFTLKPGQLIRYTIVDRKSSIAQNRYSNDSDIIDREEYARLLRKSVENLFLPFQEKQKLLFEYESEEIVSTITK